ncbi:hypothetical protein OE09_1312 [Flavobacteriaceae bacterium MAR_2010_72]|nr:hypothetical protein OE09_1312 [Flavobacteriaceae bacterium MAR_2010_72]
MKTIKSLSFVFVLALLLSSCVVKSLYAFYTHDLLHFEPKLIGNWNDSENAHWKILPFKEVILKENQKTKPSELNKDELALYNTYKAGYVVYYEKDSTKTTFLAMPFKINNQLFLDFTPIEDRESEQNENNLYKMHLINSHSLAKLDIDANDQVIIKWLDEDKLKALLDEDRIKIKHEKVGFDQTILLTASSEELVKFIEKYISSGDVDKWKTDVEVKLKRNE